MHSKAVTAQHRSTAQHSVTAQRTKPCRWRSSGAGSWLPSLASLPHLAGHLPVLKVMFLL